MKTTLMLLMFSTWLLLGIAILLFVSKLINPEIEQKFEMVATILLVVAAAFSAFSAYKSNQASTVAIEYTMSVDRPNVSVISTTVNKKNLEKGKLVFQIQYKNIGRRTCKVLRIIEKIFLTEREEIHDVESTPLLKLHYLSSGTHAIVYNIPKHITFNDLGTDKKTLIVFFGIEYQDISSYGKTLVVRESRVYKYWGGDVLITLNEKDLKSYRNESKKKDFFDFVYDEFEVSRNSQ